MTISNRIPAVRVEFDHNRKRTIKHFDDAYEARRYYATKFKSGKTPAVKKGA